MSLSLEALQEELQQCQTLLQVLSEKIYYLSEAISATSGDLQGNAKAAFIPNNSIQGNKKDAFIPDNSLQGNKTGVFIPSNQLQGNKANDLIPSNNLQGHKAGVFIPSNNFQGNKANGFIPNRNLQGMKAENYALSNGAGALTSAQVYKALRWGPLKGVRHATIHRVADMLLWIVNNPDGRMGQKHLGVWLKLSKSGSAKFMTMLFRRDLVVRKSFQNYGLTDKTKAVMEEARYVQ